MKTPLRYSLFTSLVILLLLTGHKEGFAMVKNIHWLGHDTFKITGEKVVYTDPFKITSTVTIARLTILRSSRGRRQ
jgi:hypothetical protein